MIPFRATSGQRVDRRIDRAPKLPQEVATEADTLVIKLSWLKEPIVSEYKKFDSVDWSGLRKPGNRG
jgi:hypothetical protein